MLTRTRSALGVARLGRLFSQGAGNDWGLAISPLDGRYKEKVAVLSNYFSEKALVSYRVKTEVQWLKHLQAQGILKLASNHSAGEFHSGLDSIMGSEGFYDRIKHIEKTTNHDIKAVEYYLKEEMTKREALSKYAEYVHFTCTSEDINNISYAMMLTDARKDVLGKEQDLLIKQVEALSQATKGVKMMGRTHGQSATPTTVGKEMANYVYRLVNLKLRGEQIKFAAKLNGAVGNYNAHVFVYPEYNWEKVSSTFIESLGLEWTPYSTQIECHDSMCLYFAMLKHFNTVLVGLSRDMWHYISLGYFKQLAVKGEIGSSTMPHKVNPIDFENAEGNLGVSNSLLAHFADKLPISRYQRDLSDSTVLRNIGNSFGYSLLSYVSLKKAFSRIEANSAVLSSELDSHWELLAEPIQMLMRREEVPKAYELIKEVTRGTKVTEKTITDFVEGLQVSPEAKKKMLELKPSTYTGLAEKIAGDLPNHLKRLKEKLPSDR